MLITQDLVNNSTLSIYAPRNLSVVVCMVGSVRIENLVKIRECTSTLYVGLTHAAPFTLYIAFMGLLTGCLKALLRDTPARSSGF